MSTDWKQTYDAVFFVSIATLICGILTGLIRMCIKLKCETVSLCFGLIKVDRRVDLEVQEEIRALEINSGEVIEDILTPTAHGTNHKPLEDSVHHHAPQRSTGNEKSPLSEKPRRRPKKMGLQPLISPEEVHLESPDHRELHPEQDPSLVHPPESRLA